MCTHLYGFHKQGVIVALSKSMSKLGIVQHVSSNYFCDDGTLVNSLNGPEHLLKQFIRNTYDESESQIQPILSKALTEDHSITCEKLNLKVDRKDNKPYGNCGHFDRTMSKILDTIELTRAEINGKQAVKFFNGRIQYIDDHQIKNRMFKENLQLFSKLFSNLQNELIEEGSYQSLVNYVDKQLNQNEEMKKFASANEVSELKIKVLKKEIENAKADLIKQKEDYLQLIQHLKHQKQEIKEKVVMEQKFTTKKCNAIVENRKNVNRLAESDIENEIAKYIKLCEQEELVDEDLLIFLRNNLSYLEQNIEFWSKKYQKETLNYQKILKNSHKEFTDLKTELENLSLTYVHHEKVCEEQKLVRAEQAKILESEEYFNRFALIIQKWWRYMCLNLYLGPYDTKKKKGKGKGKGKGKK